MQKIAAVIYRGADLAVYTVRAIGPLDANWVGVTDIREEITGIKETRFGKYLHLDFLTDYSKTVVVDSREEFAREARQVLASREFDSERGIFVYPMVSRFDYWCPPPGAGDAPAWADVPLFRQLRAVFGEVLLQQSLPVGGYHVAWTGCRNSVLTRLPMSVIQEADRLHERYVDSVKKNSHSFC